MSIEANTYEELHIFNANEKTAAICAQIGDYLTSTWGIIYLDLTVDNRRYKSTEDTIAKENELYPVCRSLAEAKEVSLAMRSCNGGGSGWRLESTFMRLLTDDPDIRANVTYRSTDYYDTDPGVEMYLYNENGLQRPEYSASAESVADIKEWYCYTPTLRIADETQSDNTELHRQIRVIVNKLCAVFGLDREDMEDRLDDDWKDYGEITLNGSIRFTTKDIPEIVTLANELKALLQPSEVAEFGFEIYSVPNGENDYNFASVAITSDGGAIHSKYSRF